MTIEPPAGWPRGTSRKMRPKNGPIARANSWITPAFSPTFIRPSHRLITPTRPSEMSKPVLAVSKMPVSTCVKMVKVALDQPRQRDREADQEEPDQMKLSTMGAHYSGPRAHQAEATGDCEHHLVGAGHNRRRTRTESRRADGGPPHPIARDIGTPGAVEPDAGQSRPRCPCSRSLSREGGLRRMAWPFLSSKGWRPSCRSFPAVEGPPARSPTPGAPASAADAVHGCSAPCWARSSPPRRPRTPRRPVPSATLYQVPLWVLGRDHCSATQISPRVALTTYACAVGALSPPGDGRVRARAARQSAAVERAPHRGSPAEPRASGRTTADPAGRTPVLGAVGHHRRADRAIGASGNCCAIRPRPTRPVGGHAPLCLRTHADAGRSHRHAHVHQELSRRDGLGLSIRR